MSFAEFCLAKMTGPLMWPALNHFIKYSQAAVNQDITNAAYPTR